MLSVLNVILADSTAQWWIFLVNSLILYNYVHDLYCNIQKTTGYDGLSTLQLGMQISPFWFLIFIIAGKNVISKSKNILGVHVHLNEWMLSSWPWLVQASIHMYRPVCLYQLQLETGVPTSMKLPNDDPIPSNASRTMALIKYHDNWMMKICHLRWKPWKHLYAKYTPRLV